MIGNFMFTAMGLVLASSVSWAGECELTQVGVRKFTQIEITGCGTYDQCVLYSRKDGRSGQEKFTPVTCSGSNCASFSANFSLVWSDPDLSNGPNPVGSSIYLGSKSGKEVYLICQRR